MKTRRVGAPREGWGIGHSSHLIHFFVDRVPLCGRVRFRLYASVGRYSFTRRCVHDCPTCWEALKAQGRIP